MERGKVKLGRIPIFKERFTELSFRYGSRVSFSEALGISRQTVNFWLNGDRVPDAENLITISQKMNVSVDWLLGLSELESPDVSLQAAHEYTGLSEEAIETLHRLHILEMEMIRQNPDYIPHGSELMALSRIISASQESLIEMLTYVFESWDSMLLYEKQRNEMIKNHPEKSDEALIDLSLKTNYKDIESGNYVLTAYNSAEFALSKAADCLKELSKKAWQKLEKNGDPDSSHQADGN